MYSFCRHFSDLSERSTNVQAAVVGREGTGKSCYLNPVSTQEKRSHTRKSRIADFLNGMAIPIIDLSNLLNSIPTFEETTAIRKACLDFGFFYVVNHGISRDLQANVLGNLWKFFNLSAEKKNEVHRNDGFRGYFRKEEERSIEYNCTEWKEGIYYFRDFNNVPKERKEKVFCGLNPWPKAEYVPEFRAVIEEYFRKTQELASKLLSCIALSLGKQL